MFLKKVNLKSSLNLDLKYYSFDNSDIFYIGSD